MKNNKILFLTVSATVFSLMLFAFGSNISAYAKKVQLAENDSEHSSLGSSIFGNQGKSNRFDKEDDSEKEVDKQIESNFSDSFDHGSQSSPENTPVSMSIGPQGQVRLTNADVKAVSGNILTVSVFGLSFSVDISNADISGAVVLPPIPVPSGTSTSSTSMQATPAGTTIKVGDNVTVQGAIDASTGIIKASKVRDLSSEVKSNSDIIQRINQLLDMINQLKAKLGM